MIVDDDRPEERAEDNGATDRGAERSSAAAAVERLIISLGMDRRRASRTEEEGM